MIARVTVLASITVSLILLVALAVGVTFGSRAYTVELAPGLATRLSPASVTDIATGRLEAMAAEASIYGLERPTAPRIIHVVSVRKADLPDVEPRIAGIDGAGPFWVVRAEGTFFTKRGRDAKPRAFGSGYFLIDDTLGIVVGMGMP